MISIKLLGGARKAIGKPEVFFERPSASLLEILEFLQAHSIRPDLLKLENLIIAINGVDCNVLQGHATEAKSGDQITIVTVVHGGSANIVTINDYKYSNVLVIGISKFLQEPARLIEGIREKNSKIMLQAIDADMIFGLDHLFGVIRITLEAKKRGVMLATKAEIDLLMRLAYTSQISEAIEEAGLKIGRPACFVAISETITPLEIFSKYVFENFTADDSVIKPNEVKKKRLSRLLELPNNLNTKEFVEYLLERAAILIKH
jgi:tRNA threonylcarbamoyladenosine modification (KEOPS) complex Cgi121 subunit/molybdopterin converting factor small subunit